MDTAILDALLASPARLNGSTVTALLADRRGYPAPSGDLRGRVVAVDEPDAPAVIGTLAALWEHGAIPLLTGADPHGLPWWRPGTFVLPETLTAAWALPPECALVQATSGSSGTPQLAMRSGESFLWEARAYAAAWDTDGPLVHCVRLEHSLGIGITLAALLDGRDVHHQPPVRANRLDGFGERAGVLAGTPATLRVLNEALAGRDLRASLVFCGAGALAPAARDALEHRWGPVTVGFGSTETGGVLAGPDGIGAPVPGAVLADPDPAAPFQLKVRLPHDVLGHVGGTGPVRVWQFPDLVRQDSQGLLHHVARLTRSMRSHDRTLALGRLSDVLAGMDRDWRLLETGGGAPVLIVEGPPPTPDEAAVLHTAGPDLAAVRAVTRFPRNELGKVALAELAALPATAPEVPAVERR
jgi:hypothetical protein